MHNEVGTCAEILPKIQKYGLSSEKQVVGIVSKQHCRTDLYCLVTVSKPKKPTKLAGSE